MTVFASIDQAFGCTSYIIQKSTTMLPLEYRLVHAGHSCSLYAG